MHLLPPPLPFHHLTPCSPDTLNRLFSSFLSLSLVFRSQQTGRLVVRLKGSSNEARGLSASKPTWTRQLPCRGLGCCVYLGTRVSAVDTLSRDIHGAMRRKGFDGSTTTSWGKGGGGGRGIAIQNAAINNLYHFASCMAQKFQVGRSSGSTPNFFVIDDFGTVRPGPFQGVGGNHECQILLRPRPCTSTPLQAASKRTR